MAVINTPKSFDKAQIDGDLLAKIEQFVDYVNQQFDQLTRALQNELTFSDNFKAKTITLSAYQNRELSINETASAIIPLSVLGDSINLFSSTVSNAGVQKVTFKFGNALPIRTRSVTVSSPFTTYEVENISSLQAGDKVSISAQTNALNNGSYVAAYVGTNSITVYNPSGVAATVSSYVGAYEAAKTVSILILK